MAQRPDSQLAAQVLPAALHRALVHLFAQQLADCMLVGGTALAGYYAGHRRSDDLDLFVRDAPAHQATILAIGSLTGLGGVLHSRQHTPQFYDATCELSGHLFTVQVVLDPALFRVGAMLRADDGVAIADLDTLLEQKAATLVSRCSEKDLYDLHWLFQRFPDLGVEDLVDLGAAIDAGMNAESAVVSLAGATLRESACGFARDRTPHEVYQIVTALRRSLAGAFDKLARKQPIGPVGELIRRLRP